MPKEKHMDSIGGYAQGMNISQEGLRHYERKGVIHPERDPESGYRYYSLKDTIAIAYCRKYRTYGFGLDDAVYLLHESDPEKQVGLVDNRMADMEEQIRQQTRLLNHLKARKEELFSLQGQVGRFETRTLPPACAIFTRINQETLKTREMVDLMQSWNKCQPYPDIMTLASPDYLMTGQGRVVTGLVMSPELLKELNLTCTLEIPSARCLHTALVTDWEGFTSGTYLKQVADHMREHELTPAGDTLTRIVFVTMPDQDSCTILCEVWAPV